MRAILLKSPETSADQLSVVETSQPEPGNGEVLVEVAFGGCNYADTMMRDGSYPHPKGYPLVAGLEISGRIAGLGEGVTDCQVGDRVAAFSEDAGGFADFCVVPAERLVRLPRGVSYEQGAAMMIQSLTAWHLLHTVSTTTPGDRLLIHAIGGGVGLNLTQLAVSAGARVFGTVGTPGKEEKALRFGAEMVVDRSAVDFVASFTDALGPSPFDKVLDSTGATILDRSFPLVRKLGHVVSYGEAEGRPLPNLWERLVERSLTFTRFHLGHSNFSSPQWAKGSEAVLERIGQGQLQLPIEAVYAFSDVGQMYDRLRSRFVAGKLLLAINPDL